MKIAGFTAMALCAVIAGSLGSAAYSFCSADKGMLGGTGDKLARNENNYDEFYINNRNAPLTRSDDWEQIASEELLSREDFAGIDGSASAIPLTAELARQFCGAEDHDLGRVYIGHNDTEEAYTNLIFRKDNWIAKGFGETGTIVRETGIIFALPLSDEGSHQNVSEQLESEPVALDALVFITHKDNPVNSLTPAQVRDIYAGRITNWKDVGGNNEKIRPFQRTKGSGCQELMEELVMKGEAMTEAPVAFVAQPSGTPEETVAEYENAESSIGYTYRFHLRDLYSDPDIKVLSIGGVSPEDSSLTDGSYAYTLTYNAVIRSDEKKDSIYRKLRDYLLTEEGQRIVKTAGFCPVKG